MRHHVVAQIAVATMLSIIAGLPLAEESAGSAAGPRSKAAQDSHNDSWATGDGQVGDRAALGVASRALTGNDDDAVGQPEMATGVDLKGPPVRFSADDTPE